MLSKEDTALLCEVGADKPMGQMLRRFWMPVLLSEELPEPDCTPVAVRILGEDLVAFRDSDGKVGLLSAYCPHRHAHLYWGRNEDCGLRCTYHGWKFDVDGTCTDMPNEPAETNFKDKITVGSYPTKEAGGAIWAYMGAPDKMPSDIPALEWTRVPSTHIHISKRLQENNWAQAVEGGIDSSHISYLHNDSLNMAKPELNAADRAPRMFIEPRDHGFIEAARRVVDGQHYWRIRPFFVPSAIIIPGGREVLGGHVWVPIDDEHVWVFTMSWATNRPLTTDEIEVMESGYGIHGESIKDKPRWDLAISNSWTPVRNKENNYQIDRKKQKTHSFTGIKGTGEQDLSIQESMGAISPRWEEHLGTTDRGIIEFRRLLLQLVKDFQEGIEPPHATSPDAYHVRSTAFMVAENEDWQATAAEKMKALV